MHGGAAGYVLDSLTLAVAAVLDRWTRLLQFGAEFVVAAGPLTARRLPT